MNIKNLEDVCVVGLGQACFDCLGTVPYYPPENDKIEINRMVIQCGGPVSTALTTLSRFGITTSFIGSISDDYFGKKIFKSLKEESIDTTLLKITPGYSSQFAFISINEKQGNRNIFWKRGSAPFLRQDEVDLSPFKKARFLHLDGLMIEASIEAARQAKKMGIKVVIDAGTIRQGIMDLIPFADVLIASEKFAKTFMSNRKYSPKLALFELKKFLSSGHLVITMGIEGSIGLFNNNEIIIQRAYQVDTVDTTGAGDVYHGAYIYGIIMGWSNVECMRFASAVSALKCSQIGVKKGIPSLKEVKKFMDKHRIK